MLIEDSFYEQYALICKTIVNPVRLKIIGTLDDKKMNVSEIQKELNISMSNLSNHLSALYKVGVLSRAKKGSYIYYYLTDLSLLKALEGMRDAVSVISNKKNKLLTDG